MTQRLSLQDLMRRHVRDGHPVDAVTEAALRADDRPSAKHLLAAIDRRRAVNRAEGQRLRHMLRYERDLWSKGVVHVAGVDEAGMSPLAGPVAAAAVIFAPGRKSRAWTIPKSSAPRCATGWRPRSKRRPLPGPSVSPRSRKSIPSISTGPGLLAMRRAVEGLSCTPGHVLIDARRIRDLPLAPAAHRQGRQQEPHHRGGVDPREDGPGCRDAGSRQATSGLWICATQGLSGPGARYGLADVRRLRGAPPVLRASPGGARSAAAAAMAGPAAQRRLRTSPRVGGVAAAATVPARIR